MRSRAVLRSFVLKAPALARLVDERDDLALQLDTMRSQREGLREKNRKLQHQRDRLKAQVETLRSVDATWDSLQFLFIVTYGRSGSTLLQGILGSTPGFLIRGENRAALYHLFKHYEVCRSERQRNTRGEALGARHPWFGIDAYPEGLALRDMRALVLDSIIRPQPDSRVVGFKEIRWQQKDLKEYVAFIQQLFPGARFVFNTRAHEDVAKSKWWADGPNPLAEVKRVETLQSELADSLGDNVYRVHYDDYVKEPWVLRGLFEWLGEDFDEDRVRWVMAQPHSY